MYFFSMVGKFKILIFIFTGILEIFDAFKVYLNFFKKFNKTDFSPQSKKFDSVKIKQILHLVLDKIKLN